MRAIAAEYAKLLGAITFRDYTSRIIDVLDRINVARTYNFATGQSSLSPINLIPTPPTIPTITLGGVCTPDMNTEIIRC